MKFLTLPRCLPLVLAAGFFWSLMARGAAPTVTTFARLGGDPDGYHPRAALVDGLDGNFYGTTEAGGPGNFGTVYKVAPDGTFATIYLFTGGSDGGNPVAGLVRGGDGNFYGTTAGTFPLTSGNSGTIFRVTPAGTFTTVYRFSTIGVGNQNTDGGFPVAGLTLGSDGNLYGTAQYGGATGGGTAFRLTTGGAFTVLGSFDATSLANSYLPTNALVEGDGGSFYGTTRTGGAASEGTFYRVTPGVGITTLHSFNGSTDGGYPDTALVRAADGNFYGATQASTLFQATAAGAVTTIHKFVTATEGANPSALVVGAGGNLFGTTNSRGPNGFGTFYQATTGGALTVLTGLTDGGALGYVPNALVAGGDGNFYGARTDSGSGNAGSVCRLTPAGALTTLHLFHAGGSQSLGKLLQLPDGKFYGTTSLGGTTGAGTTFSCTAAGVVTTLGSFDANSTGAYPEAGLVQDTTGNIFCTTSAGGPMNSTSTTSSIEPQIDLPGLGGGWYDFDPVHPGELAYGILVYNYEVSYGVSPEGDMVAYIRFYGQQAEATTDPTVFYGITYRGGDNDQGTVYSITADGSHTVLHQFGDQSGDGTYPQAGMVEGSDGNLYGTTTAGGANGFGTVFAMTPAGVLTTLHSFTGTDGAFPLGTLTQGNDGSFYGTTELSGTDTQGPGTIFKITSTGAFATLHAFASDGSEGENAKAGLFLAGDGNFYGTTSSGGDSFAGTVFSLSPTGVFTELHDFAPNSGEGKSPAAALIQGTDGNLYGTTQYGGTDDCGIVFRVNLATSPSFFAEQAALSNGVYYLSFPSGNYFGYYSYLTDPHYLYHFDLGYEYIFDAADGKAGVYFYDFASSDFFYSSPGFPFPYLYDFGLNTVLYYYPDPNNPGHYNTDGYRFFYRFDTGQIIVK